MAPAVGVRCREVLVQPGLSVARDPVWHRALVQVQGAKGGPGWALQCWERQGKQCGEAATLGAQCRDRGAQTLEERGGKRNLKHVQDPPSHPL